MRRCDLVVCLTKIVGSVLVFAFFVGIEWRMAVIAISTTSALSSKILSANFLASIATVRRM
jgi:predicted solute-binding protein